MTPVHGDTPLRPGEFACGGGQCIKRAHIWGMQSEIDHFKRMVKLKRALFSIKKDI